MRQRVLQHRWRSLRSLVVVVVVAVVHRRVLRQLKTQQRGRSFAGFAIDPTVALFLAVPAVGWLHLDDLSGPKVTIGTQCFVSTMFRKRCLVLVRASGVGISIGIGISVDISIVTTIAINLGFLDGLLRI